jgi:hypothetical protein
MECPALDLKNSGMYVDWPVWAYFGFKSENEKGIMITDKGMTVCKHCKVELVYKTRSTVEVVKLPVQSFFQLRF